jgi:hypothetical protein
MLNRQLSGGVALTGAVLITLAASALPAVAQYGGSISGLIRSENRNGATSDPRLILMVAESFGTNIVGKPTGPDHAQNPAANLNPADPKVIAKVDMCKSQFKAADLNGDGVLDAGEIAHYNSAIRVSEQPSLADSQRLNESGFIKMCAVGTDHE